jgi:hypothetical protein
MPNLAYELEQLELADKHIREAEVRISHMRATLKEEIAEGFDASEAEHALKAALESLEAFRQHRGLIQQNIEGIRSGELPST